MTQGKQSWVQQQVRGELDQEEVGGPHYRCPGQGVVVFWRPEGLVRQGATPGIPQMGLGRWIKVTSTSAVNGQYHKEI